MPQKTIKKMFKIHYFVIIFLQNLLKMRGFDAFIAFDKPFKLDLL